MAERIHQKTDIKELIAQGKTILVIGGSGMVGSRFMEIYGPENFIAPTNQELDITDSQSVKDYISTYQPDFIINFAAYTDVNKAENQRDQGGKSLCWRINVDGVKNLIEAIDPEKTFFVHISTDMALSGTGPFTENTLAEDDSNKLTFYGFTKAQAERLIKEKFADQAAIVRIIYPVRAHFGDKLDYLRKPLAGYDQGKLKALFSDQEISITYIDELAVALTRILDQKLGGTFHVCSSDTTTPYEVVSFLIQKARGIENPIEKSSLADFMKAFVANGGNPARYNPKGALSSRETSKRLKMDFSSVEEIVDQLVNQGVGII